MIDEPSSIGVALDLRRALLSESDPNNTPMIEYHAVIQVKFHMVANYLINTATTRSKMTKDDADCQSCASKVLVSIRRLLW